MEDGSEIESYDCFDPSTETFHSLPHSRRLSSDFEAGILTSGYNTLMQEGSYFDDIEGSLNLPDIENIVYGELPEQQRRKLAVTGSKTMLAIRVEGPDSSTTANEAFISDSWFGTSGDLVNLKTQYEACSHGKLNIIAAQDSIFTADGVHTVSITQTVIGQSDSVVRTAVVDEVLKDFPDLSTDFDHVMLCLPGGTSGGWIGYAWVNHHLSVVRRTHCGYSIFIHLSLLLVFFRTNLTFVPCIFSTTMNGAITSVYRCMVSKILYYTICLFSFQNKILIDSSCDPFFIYSIVRNWS